LAYAERRSAAADRRQRHREDPQLFPNSDAIIPLGRRGLFRRATACSGRKLVASKKVHRDQESSR
jgi:hypothetical protein